MVGQAHLISLEPGLLRSTMWKTERMEMRVQSEVRCAERKV